VCALGRLDTAVGGGWGLAAGAFIGVFSSRPTRPLWCFQLSSAAGTTTRESQAATTTRESQAARESQGTKPCGLKHCQVGVHLDAGEAVTGMGERQAETLTSRLWLDVEREPLH
jgi:hypothetical protein